MRTKKVNKQRKKNARPRKTPAMERTNGRGASKVGIWREKIVGVTKGGEKESRKQLKGKLVDI